MSQWLVDCKTRTHHTSSWPNTTFIKYKTEISHMRKFIENLMIFQWTQIRNENTQ